MGRIRRWLRGTLRADRFEADEVDAGSVSTEDLDVGGEPVEKVSRSWKWQFNNEIIDIDFDIPDLGTLDEVTLKITAIPNDNHRLFCRVDDYDGGGYAYTTLGTSSLSSDDEETEFDLCGLRSTDTVSGEWTISSTGSFVSIHGLQSEGRFFSEGGLIKGGIDSSSVGLDSIQLSPSESAQEVSSATIVIEAEYYLGDDQ